MRRRRGSELVTGLLVLAASAVATWGYFWLTAQPIGRGGYGLVVQLDDAGGLQRGDRVRLAGVQVGTVRRVALRGGSVTADISVDRDLTLPRDSRVALEATGAFGGRYLALRPGTAPDALARGDTLAAVSAPTLAETFSDVGARASQAFARASELLAPERVAELDHGARSLSRSVDQLTELTLTLRGAAARLRSRLDDDRIDSATTDLARTARSLTGASADLRTASTSLASILAKLDHGDGTLGRALNDPSLYQALLTAAGHADEAATGATELVRDVRARPGRYLNMSLF